VNNQITYVHVLILVRTKIWQSLLVQLSQCRLGELKGVVSGKELRGDNKGHWNDPPWAREGVSKLVDLTSRHIRANSLTSKGNVTNRIDYRIGPTRVDQFAVVSTLLLNQQTSNFLESLKVHIEFAGVRRDCGWRRCQFQVLIRREINPVFNSLPRVTKHRERSVPEIGALFHA
jgi:hypothetical protein